MVHFYGKGGHILVDLVLRFMSKKVIDNTDAYFDGYKKQQNDWIEGQKVIRVSLL